MTKKKQLPNVKVNYEQAYDGEWFQLVLNGDNYDQCCDCGLVHRTKYKIVDKDGRVIRGAKLMNVVWRERRSTAAVRRHFKFEKDEE